MQFFRRVSGHEKAFFAHQIAIMLGSGLHLTNAVGILAQQTKNLYFARILQQIKSDLEQGRPFSQALVRHPAVFNSVFINIVKSGEATGRTDHVLEEASKQLSQEANFISKIRGAMIYPVFVVAIMIFVGIYATVRIIPQLSDVFKDAGVEIPASTRLIMAVSTFLINYWWLAILMVIGAVLVIVAGFRTPSGQHLRDRIMLKDPSGLVIKVYMARFTRILGSLLEAGVPVVEAMTIVSEVMSNSYYKEAIQGLIKQVEKGVPISLPLSQNKLFPIFVSQMISVGEQTGKLDKTLLSLAEYYENESNDSVRNISTIFEPLVIVLIGGAVGFLVFSIIIPIYSIAQGQ